MEVQDTPQVVQKSEFEYGFIIKGKNRGKRDW